MKNFRIAACFTYLLLVIILLDPVENLAQLKSKEINIQQQTWVSINNSIRLNSKWGITADLHLRRTAFLAEPNFYFIRTGINYWLKENLSVAVGYGHLWLAPAKPGWQYFSKENRLYQQIQWSSKAGKFALLNRIRNEQRWQEKIVNDSFIHQYKFTNRVRYLVNINIRVFKNLHYPKLLLANEIMIQLGKEIVYNTFDQNRAFIGIKQSINKSLSFDFGYMLVYQQKSSGYQYDKNNTLRWFFYYSPDCRKKIK